MGFDIKGTFRVEIDGIVVADFNKADGLSAEVGESKYRQGGSRIASKQPGATVEYTDLTLSRGTWKGDTELWDWFNKVNNAASGIGATPADSFKTVDVVQLNRNGDRVCIWRCMKCWPKKFTPGTWDAESNDPQIIEVVLAMDYFVRKVAG